MAVGEKIWTKRGNVAVVALCTTTLLGFGALAVDLAWVRVHHLQLQTALDAGALGGAATLDGTPEGVDRAIATAIALATSNPLSTRVAFGASHVQVGDWDPETRTFTAADRWDADTAESIDALRMQVTVDDLPVVLGGMAFGRTGLSTWASSMGHAPRDVRVSEVPCHLPLALPDCFFPRDPTVNPPPLQVNMGDNLADRVGWALPGAVNAKAVRDHLLDGCRGEAMTTGAALEVQNGVLSSAVTTIGAILNGDEGTHGVWNSDLLGPLPNRDDRDAAFPRAHSLVRGDGWGNVLEGPVALVDVGGEPGTCVGADPFNGARRVTGFTWAVLYDAQKRSADTTGFMVQLDFVHERAFGTDTSPDAIGSLVQPGRPTLVR